MTVSGALFVVLSTIAAIGAVFFIKDYFTRRYQRGWDAITTHYTPGPKPDDRSSIEQFRRIHKR